MFEIALLYKWIKHLSVSNNAAALSLLSPDFGVHDGLDAETYVHHEIEQFRERAKIFGDFSALEIEIKPLDGGIHIVSFFSKKDRKRVFIYEDVLRFNAGGIVGNQSRLKPSQN